jgi:outer membrane protein
MSQYKFCKEYSQILQKKGQNIQNTLASKQQQLQAAGANFQQKLQQNAYTREQAEAIQAGLQKQAADLDALNTRLTNEFQVETEKFNEALRDSIQHFLAKFNKDKKYSIILSKAGDNLLYADKTYDITDAVIAGLNKAYKSSPATKAAAKEEKKK